MNLPTVSPGVTLAIALGTDIATEVVGLRKASPVIWAGAGVYSVFKGHPIWGGAFFTLSFLAILGNARIDEMEAQKALDAAKQVTSGPKLAAWSGVEKLLARSRAGAVR